MAETKLNKEIQGTFQKRTDRKFVYMGKGKNKGEWFFSEKQAKRCFSEGYETISNPNYVEPKVAETDKAGK